MRRHTANITAKQYWVDLPTAIQRKTASTSRLPCRHSNKTVMMFHDGNPDHRQRKRHREGNIPYKKRKAHHKAGSPQAIQGGELSRGHDCKAADGWTGRHISTGYGHYRIWQRATSAMPSYAASLSLLLRYRQRRCAPARAKPSAPRVGESQPFQNSTKIYNFAI